MAEGTHIIIDGCGNDDAIVLQKASSFFCNDIEITGIVKRALMAYSGSTLLAGIIGDLGPVRATTGSKIIIEKYTGKLIGPIKADKMGQIIMPDADSINATKGTRKNPAPDEPDKLTEPEPLDPATLPALHQVVYGGHDGEVKQLLAAGADIQASGPNGWTALHIAALKGHQMISRLLISNGADIHALDEQNHTPAELAEIHGHNALATFLQNEDSENN